MKSKVILYLVAILPILYTACEKNPGSDSDRQMKEIALTPVQKSLVIAGNEFALNLFRTAFREEQNQPRFFLSPYSIAEALTMALNGASGSTADSMEKVLCYSGMNKDEINSYCLTLRSALLKVDPKVQLSIANSIWYRTGFSVLPSFIECNKTYFGAAVRELDFSSSGAPEAINSWVADKTNNRIQKVIEEIDPATVMFLINAIWFKGKWAYQFDKNQTIDKTFTCAGRESVTVPFMQQEHTFSYFSNEAFAMAEMPYGQGNFAMVVLLPGEGKSPENIVPLLTPENWTFWKSQMQEKKLRVEFPRLKFEYKITLNQVLSDMGMGIAFTEMADFSGINPVEDLLISRVMHNSYLEVNEEGTEAAAVTTVEVNVTSVPVEPEIIPFVVNRPFIFFIHERSTGAILFMGMINNPL